jgi:hypothetical protein
MVKNTLNNVREFEISNEQIPKQIKRSLWKK